MLVNYAKGVTSHDKKWTKHWKNGHHYSGQAMTKIPFIDFGRMYDPLREQLHKAALEVIDSGRYIGGEQVKGFEREMASWLGVEQVCGVSCATMGLFALLKSMGIGPGDEVITTVHTAIATAESVSHTGAQVIFCDIKEGYFYLDPHEVERKITPRTKAIIPVHLYGQSADMDGILSIAKRHSIAVIEDCAQAQGAQYRGRMAGTLGDAAVFSFFPSKTLGGFGDGGAVTARDPALMKRVRLFSNHGRESKYLHEFEGINSRLDAIQAALLRVLLPHLDEWNEQRRIAAKWYDEGLSGLKEIAVPRALPDTLPVYHVYVCLTPDRDALIKHLHENGIETGIHYPYSLNVLPAYAHLGQGAGSYPRAEYACAHMLSLPLHPAIAQAEVQQVCETIKKFFGR